MSNQPLVSIVIPTYNRADLLKLCLDSVIAQTYTNWEAIIIDNFSVDNNAQVAASYNDPRIRFYQNANNGVIAVSRNKGMSLSKGEVICFLDSDDIWTADKLEVTIPYLKEYDFIYHDMIIYHYEDNVISYSKKLKGRDLGADPYKDALSDGNPCINSSLAIKRSLIDKVGTISEDPNLIAVEDFDFELRLLQHARPKYINKVLGYYLVAQSNASNNERQVIRMENLYNLHLVSGFSDSERREIRARLAYRQARIYQVHGNKEAALAKYKAVFKSRSLYYLLRTILFSFITRFIS